MPMPGMVEIAGDEYHSILGTSYNEERKMQEMLGWDMAGGDVIGNDMAILGAIAKTNPALAGAMLRKKMAGATLARTTPAKSLKKRIYMIGFDSVAAIAAAAQTVQTQSPQVTFKGTRLLIPATVGASFVINDFRVGIHPQFITTTGVPGQGFAETVTDNDLDMDTANPGVNIIITATNISAGAVRFQASVRGIALED